MDKLTCFTDTSDVSDAAIEWVLKASGGNDTVAFVRRHAIDPFMTATRSRIIAARLIQQHHPELLVDPVDAIVDEWMQKACFKSPVTRAAAKRLYQMGLAAGKGQNNA
jgi:ABC-type ATPase with predicted acetyltransferase domain